MTELILCLQVAKCRLEYQDTENSRIQFRDEVGS